MKNIIQIQKLVSNKLEIIGVDPSDNKKIIVRDPYGVLSVNRASLLRGCEPGISSSVNPVSYVRKLLGVHNKSYKEGFFKFVGFIKSNRSEKICLVKTPYGYCKVSYGNLRTGYKPTIESAVDKQGYFLNKLRILQKSFFKGPFKIMGVYTKNTDKLIIQTRYGLCKITPAALLSGVKPSLRSAIDKTEFYINMCNTIHKNKYSYPSFVYKSMKDKIEVVCPIHGSYKINTNSHRQAGCKKCSGDYNSYFKKDWINQAGSREGTFYVLGLQNGEEEFIKIGITFNSIKKRYPSKLKMPYSYKILYEKKDSDLGKIWDLERFLKSKLKPYRYKPKHLFAGCLTECFNYKSLKEIIHEL